MKQPMLSANIQRSFVRNAQIMTNVMTPKGDVKVLVKGGTAYTDHKVIVIPRGDFSDEGFVRLVKGLVDHECGHINFTQEGSMPEAHKRSKLTAKFFNIIEDVRMESCVMKAFPGCEYNLLDTVKEAINREWFAEPQDGAKPVSLVQSYVLYRGRSEFLGQYPVAKFAQVAEEQLAQSFGSEFALKLCEIVDQIPQLKTSREALGLANQVIDMLEEELDEQETKDEQQQAEGDSSNNPPSDSDDESSDTDSDGSGQSQSSDKSGDPSDSDDDSNGQSSKSDSNESAEDEDGDSTGDTDESDDDANEGDLTAKEKAKQLAEMLDADDDDLMDDLHEKIQDALSEDAQQAQKECRAAGEGDVQEVGRFHVNGNLDKTDAIAASRSITPPLKRLLMDKNRHDVRYQKRGSRLSNAKLTSVATGNYNVFQHDIISKSPNTAVSILVDRSYSMGDPAGNGKSLIDVANECTYALSHTMERLKGVSTEVTYYPFGYCLHLAKSFKETTANCFDRFRVTNDNGTPTGEAIATAMRSLLLQSAEKKILFVITDGEAQDENTVRESIMKAKACGVQVVGIGIGTGFLAGFEGAGFVSVSHVSELHVAIKEIFQQSLVA